jgi:hypothetical protein
MLNSTEKVNLFDGILTKELKNDLMKYQELAREKTLEACLAYDMINYITQELLTRESNYDVK